MHHLASLLPYLRPYRRRLLIGIACVAGTAWVGLLAPLVIGDAIDQLRLEVSVQRLLVYGLLLIAITAVKGIFQFFQRKVLVTVSRDVERDLRDRFFAHLTRLDGAFFQRRSTGDLMARATNDMEAVRQVCGPAVMYAANTVLTAIGTLIFMVRISPALTGLVLVTLPLIALVTRVIGQRIHVLFGEVQASFSDLSGKVQENVAGSRVVRAYTQERAERHRFAAESSEYVERNRALIRWNAAFHPLLQAVTGLGFALVLWYGGSLMLAGTITIGEFVTFQLFLAKLTWPMIAIGWVINLLSRGAASLQRIREVIDSEPAIREPETPIRVAAIDGAIAAHGLTFAHDADSPPVLVDVDLAVAAGETLAIVGRTGSGKSTLLGLIPRMLEPPPGTLTVDGHDVRELPLEVLRGAIAMVPQETFLFSATVGENIALGVKSASEEAIREVAYLAGLESDIQALPRGLDTMVGERGVTLSGGQKQRVALARALLRDPRILLLDDCLSAVDTRTEETILRNLRSFLPGRTVLLVSHRVSAARLADRILVLDDGRVHEQGSHEELLELDGLYADLHRRQRLEDALAAV